MWRRIICVGVCLIISACGSGSNTGNGNSDSNTGDSDSLSIGAANLDTEAYTPTLLTTENGLVTVESSTIELQLPEPLNQNTINPNSFILTDSDDKVLFAEAVYLEETQIIRLDLFPALEISSTYQLTLNAELFSESGKPLVIESALEIRTTQDIYAPKLIGIFPEQDIVTPYVNLVYVTFDESLDPSSVTADKFVLRDRTTNIAYDFDIELQDDNRTVSINPKPSLLYNSKVEFIVKKGLADLHGNVFPADYNVQFSVSQDYDGPVVTTAIPAAGAINARVDVPITIEFNENIDATIIDASGQYLALANSAYKTGFVPITTSVSDNILTITPVEPLKYETLYEVSFYNTVNSTLRDERGNYSHNAGEWTFSTERYPNRINVSTRVDSFELNTDNNILYTLDSRNSSFTAIDLNNDQVATSFALDHTPSRLCIDTDSDRIFITNLDANVISQYRISDYQKMVEIPWSGGENAGHAEAHYHIACRSESLFVSDAAGAPKLYRIDRNTPHLETQLSGRNQIRGINEIGGFSITPTGDILTWMQYGWDSGLASSEIRRYTNSNDNWIITDKSTLSYPDHLKEPLDTPMLVDESSSALLHKQYIFNVNNLSQVIHDFGKGEVIYAADFTHQRVASLQSIYSLTDYHSIGPIPVNNVDALVFDTEGDLYMISNDASAMYIKRSF